MKKELQKKIDYLRSELQQIQAVEVLEYHNKNKLSGDNKSRSVERQSDLKDCLRLVNEIEKSV